MLRVSHRDHDPAKMKESQNFENGIRSTILLVISNMLLSNGNEKGNYYFNCINRTLNPRFGFST